MFCQFCGHKKDEDALFCIQCGRKISLHPTQTRKSRISKRNIVRITLISLALISVISIVLLYIGNRDTILTNRVLHYIEQENYDKATQVSQKLQYVQKESFLDYISIERAKTEFINNCKSGTEQTGYEELLEIKRLLNTYNRKTVNKSALVHATIQTNIHYLNNAMQLLDSAYLPFNELQAVFLNREDYLYATMENLFTLKDFDERNKQTSNAINELKDLAELNFAYYPLQSEFDLSMLHSTVIDERTVIKISAPLQNLLYHLHAQAQETLDTYTEKVQELSEQYDYDEPFTITVSGHSQQSLIIAKEKHLESTSREILELHINGSALTYPDSRESIENNTIVLLKMLKCDILYYLFTGQPRNTN